MSGAASRRFVAVVTVGTLGLLGVFALVDAGRPWRAIQHDFLQRETDALERRLAEILDLQGTELASLEAAVEAAEERYAGRRTDVETLEASLRQLDHEAWRAELHLRQAEEAGDTSAARDSRREVEALAELRGQQRERLTALRAELDIAQRALAEHQELSRPLRRRLDELDATAWWRGIPWLGRFAPPIAVRSLVPETRGPGRTGPEITGPGITGPEIAAIASGGPAEVERCVTCHLTTVREDLADTNWPPPLRPHPRPDLFVAADSPHPVAVFGCTACHGGDGRSTDFGRAGHTPRDATQAQDWRERLGRRPGPPGAPQMLPMDLVESGCGSCHTEATGVAEAPALATGRQLRRTLGCDSCHRDPTPSAKAPGTAPSLIGLARKTDRRWLARWLATPGSHPGFEPLGAQDRAPGTDAEAGSDASRTELAAMVRALWIDAPASDPVSAGASASPPEGDAERGRRLFDTLGCRACHGFATTGSTTERPSLAPAVGPSRGRTAAWLFAFLRNPQAVEPTTRMPDPRLSAREAADLTAALRAPDGPDANPPLPEVDSELRDRWLLDAFESEATLEASAARLASLDDDARTLDLGRHLLVTRGCHGCHAVPGLGDAPPPALPWSVAVLRPLLGEAFRHPRLRLDLDPDADRALRIALLAEGRTRVRDRRPQVPSTASSDDRGVTLIASLGCQGCHAFEGRPSALTRAGVAGADGIPALDHLGSKLRPSWLATTLRDPEQVAVRPWLTVRMPRYRLDPAAIDLLIRTLSRRSPVPWVVAEPPTPDRQTLEAGRALFEMMQCDGCHYGTETLLPGPPAPDYGNARQRLRPAWVVDWILDPERFASDSGMPASFLASGHGGYDSSFLVGSLEMPMFGAQHRRLRRAFDDEAALLTHLENPQWVAEALRAHLWTKTPGSTLAEAVPQVDP